MTWAAGRGEVVVVGREGGMVGRKGRGRGCLGTKSGSVWHRFQTRRGDEDGDEDGDGQTVDMEEEEEEEGEEEEEEEEEEREVVWRKSRWMTRWMGTSTRLSESRTGHRFRQ